MKICFLGQQGWSISSGCTTILVDPVLTETFGTSPNLRFRVYPPRSINTDIMPKISAVFITNEHLDHFHLPSINRLDRSTQIYVGELMPDCVRESIISMGFNLSSLKNQQVVNINNLQVRLFIGSKNTPFWEKRVYQLYCMDESRPDQGGIYIQSDTLLSEHFLKLIKQKLLPPPAVYITTNNAQIMPEGTLGALDNLLPITDESEDKTVVGLRVLDEIVVQYPRKLSFPKHIVLSGGGYIQDKAPFGPFIFSDYKRLAELSNKLSLDTLVHGLLPGEELDTSSSFIEAVNWISIDNDKWKKYSEFSKADLDNYEPLLSEPIYQSYAHSSDVETSLSLIEDELLFMAKILICSTLGTQLTAANNYIDGPTDSKRFVFNIRTSLENKQYQYALDLQKGKFVKIDSLPFETLIRKFPYGIDVFLEDFIALLEGKIQIWELATANMRQWYLGSKLDSPIAFLYKYFSEQVRQDLALKVYENLYAQ